MNNDIKDLEGSPLKDRWKRLHKNLRKDLYGLDIDFILYDFIKGCQIVIATLDIKSPYDKVTKGENKFYSMRNVPTYIIEVIDVEVGIQNIFQFINGEKKLEAICSSWEDYEKWEIDIRQTHKRKLMAQAQRVSQ